MKTIFKYITNFNSMVAWSVCTYFTKDYLFNNIRSFMCNRTFWITFQANFGDFIRIVNIYEPNK